MKSERPTPNARRARSLARRVMTDFLGGAPDRVAQQSGGLTNFVFLVKGKDDEFVVRIAPELAKLDGFIKEQWVVKKARGKGVPTPEILEVGQKIIPLPYMITRRAHGRPATNHPNRLAILEELGGYAARINAIATHDFGGTFDWADKRLGRHTRWTEFLEVELHLGERLKVLERYGGVAPVKCRKIREVLWKLAGPRARPALNHGDLRLKNVIVDEANRITAILDWENCTSNVAPQWELSLALHDLAVDESQAFLRGYGLRPRQIEGLAPGIKALNIINYAQELERLAKENDRTQLEHYQLRLKGVLDLYSL